VALKMLLQIRIVKFFAQDDLIGKAENLYCNQLPEFLQDEVD